ncbi:MAG TPA: dienelactone hydrolase family protein [Acidimicrobiales bacterium]|nr:dienelactone hydrolase family protein [Acidimicrobiales bacterium]
MGEIIDFPSNGSTGQGYIAYPSNGSRSTPGIIVLQEWWGLVEQIKRTCDRFAGAGFTALAPDLFEGTTVPLTEPDEAGTRMMALEMGSVAKDLSGAVDELIRRTGRPTVGVIGFCMGGGLALVLATQRPDAVKAVVPAYGLIPWPDARPDYTKLDAAVLAHAAGQDEMFTVEDARALEAELTALGNEVGVHVYPDVGHAFFNEDRPEVYDRESAELLWDRTVSFFRQKLS